MRVVALSGSLRGHSYNTTLLDVALSRLPAGTDVERWARLAEVPAFDEDVEHATPAAVRSLAASVRASDAVLIATPEYNGSLPGALKNALDWVSRPYADNPFMNKPASTIGASTGLFGAAWAQADLRRVLRTMGARVAEAELAVPLVHEAFAADPSRLADPEQDAALSRLVAELADAAEQRRARLVDSSRDPERPTTNDQRSTHAA